jgi:hypothetical protein
MKSGGRSVGIVRLRTQATEFFLVLQKHQSNFGSRGCGFGCTSNIALLTVAIVYLMFLTSMGDY